MIGYSEAGASGSRWQNTRDSDGLPGLRRDLDLLAQCPTHARLGYSRTKSERSLEAIPGGMLLAQEKPFPASAVRECSLADDATNMVFLTDPSLSIK